MNDSVRKKLSEIIKRYGREICNEPRRCKGLLLDHCAGDRREVFVLVSALEEQVVSDLMDDLGSQSWTLVAGRLSRRLVEHRAMAEAAALWAVESWALALGVITERATTPGPVSPPNHGLTGRPADPITTRVGSVQCPPVDERREARPTPDLITTRVGQVLLKLIPAGEFWMGSPDGDDEAFDDEKPRHKVRISEAFYLGATPVTQSQYRAVTGKSPSRLHGRPENPVESVSWYDATQFCNKLSMKEGLAPYYAIPASTRVRIVGGPGYRLPTEAEWEYACRAGTETRYCFGDGEPGLGEYAWYSANSEGHPWPVGQKRPNAWGLYDMHGNVWEWCWDRYEEGYYQNSPEDDPLGAEEALRRVFRGGCWNDKPRDVRSAARYSYALRYNYLGFRIARGLSSP
ncbi:MAG: formylglycine-generating enzyme family protein [Isosphaeraceae bacterium]